MKRLLIAALALVPLAACSHSREQNAAAPAYNSSGSTANSTQGTSNQPDQNPRATQAPTNLRTTPPGQSGVGQTGDNDTGSSMTNSGPAR